MDDSFFQKYFDYVGESESPLTYHRWSLISLVGALLERQFYFPFGHVSLYPSQYIMLMGEAGARKSSAIGIAEKLAHKAGFKRFAADRLSKEMFLKSMMMHKQDEIIGDDANEDDVKAILDDLLDVPVGDLGKNECSSIYAAADEFLDLVGPANVEFLTMFTKLWDNKDEYSHPKLHGMDVKVIRPTVNILAGSTPTTLSLACPPEVVGTGFMSRMLLIHSDPSGKKFYLPKKASEELEAGVVKHLKEIMKTIQGEAHITAHADKAMETIYNEFPPLTDYNFKHYNSRRYVHMLKIALIVAAMELSPEIHEHHILQANTILHYAECRMPKALGEFGKAKNSSTQSDILNILASSPKPVKIQELWEAVGKDLARPSELVEITKNLIYARKVAAKDDGFIAINIVREEWGNGLVLTDYLHFEEMS